MKEIKSFREYIEEQEKLKLFEGEEPKVDDETKAEEQKPAQNQSSKSSKKDRSPKTEIITRRVNSFSFSKFINFNDNWRILFANLRAYFNQLNDTYKALKEGVYTDIDITLSPKDYKPSQEQIMGTSNDKKVEPMPLDITHGNSIGTYRSEIEKLVKENLVAARKAKITADKVRNVNKGLFGKSERREDLAKTLNLIPKDKEDSESPDVPAASSAQSARVFKEEENIDEATLIGRALKSLNPFQRSNYGIQSGIGNKYSEDKIIRTVRNKKDENYNKNASSDNAENYGNDEKRSIYNLDDNFLSNMAKKFSKDSNTLIDRELLSIRATLLRAQIQIAKFEKVGALNDNRYLTKLYNTLHEVALALTRVGSNIEDMAKKYNNSCMKVVNELAFVKHQDEKYLDSSKAEKEIQKAGYKVAKQKEIDDLANARREAEEKIHKERAEATSKAIESNNKIDNAAVDYLIDYLKNNVTSRNEITPDLLKKELKKAFYKTETNTLIKAEALYILATLLKNNELSKIAGGPKSEYRNLAVKDELLNMLQKASVNNIDEPIEFKSAIEKIIYSPDEVEAFEKNRNQEKIKKAKGLINAAATNTIEKNIDKNLSVSEILDNLSSIKENKYPELNQAIKIGDSKLKGGDERKTAETLAYCALLKLIDDKRKYKGKSNDYEDDEEFKLTNNAMKITSALESVRKELDSVNGNYKSLIDKYLNPKENTPWRSLIDDSKHKKRQETQEVQQERKVGTANRPASAKDFNGEPPKPQAASIFDYAVQKAKDLQNR